LGIGLQAIPVANTFHPETCKCDQGWTGEKCQIRIFCLCQFKWRSHVNLQMQTKNKTKQKKSETKKWNMLAPPTHAYMEELVLTTFPPSFATARLDLLGKLVNRVFSFFLSFSFISSQKQTSLLFCSGDPIL